jgi:hypothetical protein
MSNNSAFRKTLEYNGAKECCHYEDKGYNPSQSKTAPLSFGVSPRIIYRSLVDRMFY